MTSGLPDFSAALGPVDSQSGLERVFVTDAQTGLRLDKCLATSLPALSRVAVQRLIAEGQVRIDSVTVRQADRRVKGGEVLTLRPIPPPSTDLPAQAMDLTIVHEDAHILVINKPAGLVVHPGAGNPDGTLVNALMAHCGPDLLSAGGPGRPGLVHRLDKQTSGLMVVAKTARAHQHLSGQFADRSLSRTYQAVVWGLPLPAQGRIEAAIGRDPKQRTRMAVDGMASRSAVTHYRVLRGWGRQAALVECRLETGRTHQIRVHLSHIGHAVVGDPVYAGRPIRGAESALRAFPRQALHAVALRLIHPASGEPMNFEAGVTADMAALIARMETGV